MVNLVPKGLSFGRGTNLVGSGHVTHSACAEDVLKIDSCSYLAKCREEDNTFSSKQTHMFDCFICYNLESGWHVTRPNQGLSLGRGKSLGTRLKFGLK